MPTNSALLGNARLLLGRCEFCDHGEGYRRVPVEEDPGLLAEVKHLRDKYGQTFHFTDESYPRPYP